VTRRGKIDYFYAKQLLYFGPSAIITFSWSSLPVRCKLINFLFYFPVLQMFLSSYVKKILNSNDYIRALYAVISGPQVGSVPCYYTVKKVSNFPVPTSRHCFSLGRIWLVTSRLGKGKSLTFFNVQCTYRINNPLKPM
jgi:hypothetical protein